MFPSITFLLTATILAITPGPGIAYVAVIAASRFIASGIAGAARERLLSKISGAMEALQLLVAHPKHREVKEKQSKWLAGYRVIISQVLRTYGDSKLAEQLPKLALT